MNKILVNHIAKRAYDLMVRQKIVVDGHVRPVIYPLAYDDRLLLICDPEMIKNQQKVLSKQFRHDLATILSGRRVVQTNSRGIILQVAWNPPPAKNALRSVPLDLTMQPTPLHMPIANTYSGPFWVSIIDVDLVIVAGRRGMGKSRLIHGCIQALKHGGQTELYLHDGKGGMEFLRYANSPNVHMATDNLRYTLIELQSEVQRRQSILMKSGATSIIEHNERCPDQKLSVMVLVVDEIANIPDDCRSILADLIGRCRAYGVYGILGTTYPGYKEVGSLIKMNSGMRICFAVPTANESRVVLGANGAEDLPKIKGRMLFEWRASYVMGQAFDIQLPDSRSYQGPTLTGIELDIANYALQGQRTLSIELLKQVYSMSKWNAEKLLKQWESRGWLEKDRNQANARVPTALLAGVLAESVEPLETPETPETDITQPIKVNKE